MAKTDEKGCTSERENESENENNLEWQTSEKPLESVCICFGVASRVRQRGSSVRARAHPRTTRREHELVWEGPPGRFVVEISQEASPSSSSSSVTGPAAAAASSSAASRPGLSLLGAGHSPPLSHNPTSPHGATRPIRRGRLARSLARGRMLNGGVQTG